VCVFYGEGLDRNFGQRALLDINDCDLLIVMGTSLNIEWTLSFVEEAAAKKIPLALVNNQHIPIGNMDWNHWLHKPCDEVCEALAEKLGWKAQLEALKKGYAAQTKG